MLARILLSASLLAPPPVAAQPPWLHGMWTDGDGLLAVIELDAVRLSCRSGEEQRLEGLRNLEDVAGAWVAGAPVIAALAEDGPLVRWRDEAWTRTLVPRVDESKLLAVAVDARGRVVVAGAKGAAYRLDGERWETLVYPMAMTAVGLAARADGSFNAATTVPVVAFPRQNAECVEAIMLGMPKQDADLRVPARAARGSRPQTEPNAVLLRLDARLPGDAPKPGESAREIAGRVATKIDVLGEGSDAAKALVDAGYLALSDVIAQHPSDRRGAKRVLQAVLAEWLPRRYGSVLTSTGIRSTSFSAGRRSSRSSGVRPDPSEGLRTAGCPSGSRSSLTP